MRGGAHKATPRRLRMQSQNQYNSINIVAVVGDPSCAVGPTPPTADWLFALSADS